MCDVLYSKTSTYAIEQENWNQNVDDLGVNLECTLENPVLNQGTVCDIIKKVRKTMKMFKNSPRLEDLLREKTILRPILDCKTRWSSIAEMLNRYTEIKTAINVVFANESIEMIITKSEVAQINMIINCLQPIEHAIKELSKIDSNLLTADFVISEMLAKIKQAPEHQFRDSLLDALISRVNQRRTRVSDILYFFYKENIPNAENLLYVPISTGVIIDYYRSTFMDNSGENALQTGTYFSHCLAIKGIL